MDGATRAPVAALAVGVLAAAGCAGDDPAAEVEATAPVTTEAVPVGALRGGVPPEVDPARADRAGVADGWHAKELLGAEVEGPGGAKIGEVANIVIGPDAMIEAIVFEAEGALDVGGTHLRVPWEEVRPAPGLDTVAVPVTRDNVQDYGLFLDFQAREPRAFRATELIGDYVSLEDHPAYAIVDDLVFSPAGELRAVVVAPDVAFARTYGGPVGPFPLPYYAYDFDPGVDFLDLPYRSGDIGAIERFDFPMMGD